MITQGQSNAARAIACPKCLVGAGEFCLHGNPAEKTSHAIRTHLYLASVRPLPTAAVCAALTEIAGTRADTKPFVHWLDGAHEFRSQSSGANNLAMGVYLGDATKPVAMVRRALLDMATAHGLLVSHPVFKGRGRHEVTARGRALHAAGGDLQRFLAALAARDRSPSPEAPTTQP
ncbi:hypothetical protein [uncultured Zoogloea sp.]|uniref:hypothetical protein n=1 Tax=uncultured Zoogloea sp. TaxID=160237 RepID=UPI0026394A96|nr:hypothetical protein [uncultured Zoogloea sp.]